MESGKMAPPKNAPRDALVMAQILKDMGITEYEPRVINQMLEFAFRYVTTILDDAKIYSSHAKKPNVDADDVRLAIQCRADQSFTSPPPRDFLLDIARQKNQTPLPLIKSYVGPRLPPDRYCLTAPNYKLKSLIKKGPNQGRLVPRLSVGAVSSRPTTPTIDKTSSGKRNKRKNKRMGLQTKKFLYSKETINKTKRQLTEWEKIVSNDTSDKRLITKIYEELTQLNNKKTIELKNGRRT
uniref:TATA-box binding protein associated factor 9b n=1 Tax=Rousettus aegyptiacus TaxID=9407 RepID=A0A7J8EMA7_ROUAE|nr:TATA-box binding protein associated factor 9b [Rousettus aegyptiacus]